MDLDHIKEPKDGLIKFKPNSVEEIRKLRNIGDKVNREEAIAIIDEWIKKQDHFTKKDFSKHFIEVSLMTCNGSIERAKKQIDKLFTMKTMMPEYFQITNLLESDVMQLYNKGIGLVPNLTEDNNRVLIMKINRDVEILSSDFQLFYKLFVVLAEYIKSNDYVNGIICVCDYYDNSAADILPKMNLFELQQFVPIMTEGYGAKIKSIVFVTASKFIEGFIKVMKPFFSQKIGKRIHAVTSREALKNLINGDVLPEEYGGSGKSLEELHVNCMETLSSPPIQQLLQEMNKAVTDESKRPPDNSNFIEMSGTFRNLNVD